MSLRHFSVGSTKRSHAACGAGWDWSVEHGSRIASDRHALAKTVDKVTCRKCKNTPVYRRALERHERKRRPSSMGVP